MHIVKLTGAQGAGKSEALGHLAELHQSTRWAPVSRPGNSGIV